MGGTVSLRGCMLLAARDLPVNCHPRDFEAP
jgi:hypothetical protein